MEEEKEEIAIADELTNIKMQQVLTHLLRNGQIKKFYMKGKARLKIKWSNPVVTKVQNKDGKGDTKVYEEKSAVDG